MTTSITKNSATGITVTTTQMIDWLVGQGLPPLPVAPAQDATKYPAKNKDGTLKLDKDGNPVPLFPGKNPSYLDKNGKPRIIKHEIYQDRMPTQDELEKWFGNPQNGVGGLGRPGIRYLDIDSKDFESQEACDQYFLGLLERKPELKNGLLAKTQGGGYRIVFGCKDEPKFVEISAEPGGKRIGELRKPGLYTVLPPTIGPTGNPYTLLSPLPDELPMVDVDFIHPYSKSESAKKKSSTQPSLPGSSTPAGEVDLADCLCPDSKEILAGNDVKGDRSDSLTTLANELYGWENWLSHNGVGCSGNTDSLALEAGATMGMDEDRVRRILQTIDRESCTPAAYHLGGDLACWRKVYKLSPNSVPKDIAKEFKKRPPKPPKNFAIPSSANIPDGFPGYTQHEITGYLANKYRGSLTWNIDTKEWMKFDGSIWKPEPIEVIQNLVIKDLDAILDYHERRNKFLEDLGYKTKDPGTYSSGFVKSILELLAAKLHTKKWDKISDLIPFKNGCLNLVTGKLEPHQASNRLTWCLPYDYNPLATCPQIESWFNSQVGQPDQIQLLRAYLKAIVTGRTELQKFIELIGPGGSGKGTYTRLAQALVGCQNTHITTLEKLETNRFETAALPNKRLLVVTDSGRYGGSVDILKAITGSDSIPFEQKHKQQTNGFKPDCMVLLAANETIQFKDDTSGLARRRITVPFKHVVDETDRRDLIEFRGEEPIGEFADELPGLMNWVLAMPDDEVTRLIRCSTTAVPSLAQARWETLIESNNIASWLNEMAIRSDGERFPVGKVEFDRGEVTNKTQGLYPSYVNYCHSTGGKPVAMNRFSGLLEDLIRNQLKWQGISKHRDERGSFFLGLRLRTVADSHIDPIITGHPTDAVGTAEMTNPDVPMTYHMTNQTLTTDKLDEHDGLFENKREKKNKNQYRAGGEEKDTSTNESPGTKNNFYKNKVGESSQSSSSLSATRVPVVIGTSVDTSGSSVPSIPTDKNGLSLKKGDLVLSHVGAGKKYLTVTGFRDGNTIIEAQCEKGRPSPIYWNQCEKVVGQSEEVA